MEQTSSPSQTATGAVEQTSSPPRTASAAVGPGVDQVLIPEFSVCDRIRFSWTSLNELSGVLGYRISWMPQGVGVAYDDRVVKDTQWEGKFLPGFPVGVWQFTLWDNTVRLVGIWNHTLKVYTSQVDCTAEQNAEEPYIWNLAAMPSVNGEPMTVFTTLQRETPTAVTTSTVVDALSPSSSPVTATSVSTSISSATHTNPNTPTTSSTAAAANTTARSLSGTIGGAVGGVLGLLLILLLLFIARSRQNYRRSQKKRSGGSSEEAGRDMSPGDNERQLNRSPTPEPELFPDPFRGPESHERSSAYEKVVRDNDPEPDPASESQPEPELLPGSDGTRPQKYLSAQRPRSAQPTQAKTPAPPATAVVPARTRPPPPPRSPSAVSAASEEASVRHDTDAGRLRVLLPPMYNEEWQREHED